MTSEEYAYAKPSVKARIHHPYRSHLRKKNINIMTDNALVFPAPYENGMRVVMWSLAVLLVLTLFTNMIVGVFGFDPPWWFFALFLASAAWAALAIITFGWWRWNRRKEPYTIMVITGGGRRLPAADWTPGSYLRVVDLKKDPLPLPPSATANQAKDQIPVEVIPHKRTMQGVPQVLRKSLFAVTIARATVTNPKTGQRVAGHQRGFTYPIYAASEPHLAVDLPNWRGYDWYALARSVLGKKLVRNNTLINLMLEPMDADTWEEPAKDRTIEKELYEVKQAYLNVSIRHGEFVSRRADHRSTERRADEP